MEKGTCIPHTHTAPKETQRKNSRRRRKSFQIEKDENYCNGTKVNLGKRSEIIFIQDRQQTIKFRSFKPVYKSFVRREMHILSAYTHYHPEPGIKAKGNMSSYTQKKNKFCPAKPSSLLDASFWEEKFRKLLRLFGRREIETQERSRKTAFSCSDNSPLHQRMNCAAPK